MSEAQFDALIDKMRKIAEAVNAFDSEAIQQSAFSALLNALGGSVTVPSQHQSSVSPSTFDDASRANQPKRDNSKAKSPSERSAVPRGKWTFNRNLNLRPPGKTAFVDFVDEKKPKSNEDRFVVAVYYLAEIAGEPTVSIGDVGSIFRLMPAWREPKQLDAGLRMASSRKGTLDTSNLDDIKLTPTGRNYVEHDLPPNENGKS